MKDHKLLIEKNLNTKEVFKGKLLHVFYDDASPELGVDLIFRLILFLYLICTFFLSPILAKDSKDTQKSPPPKTATYKYWNADRRILDLKGDPQTFYGQVYYDVAYNKEGRIKTVTRMGENREPQETYHLIWNRSGTQSEYKIEFLTPGNASRLDDYLYSNKLSHVRPGWIADFKSRKDGRPKEVSFSDKSGTALYLGVNGEIIDSEAKQVSLMGQLQSANGVVLMSNGLYAFRADNMTQIGNSDVYQTSDSQLVTLDGKPIRHAGNFVFRNPCILM